jgi:phage portal protein BeeE
VGIFNFWKRDAAVASAAAPPARIDDIAYAEAAEARSILENPAIPLTPAAARRRWGMGPTRSGVQINERTALTYSAVFAAVKVLSEAVAMLPLKVYEG